MSVAREMALERALHDKTIENQALIRQVRALRARLDQIAGDGWEEAMIREAQLKAGQVIDFQKERLRQMLIRSVELTRRGP